MATEAEQRKSYLDALPEHLVVLGEIVRESVLTGDMDPFAVFLAEQKIAVPPGQLERFRDLVILRRLDLKDLEPAARERLRARMLDTENPLLRSADYQAAEVAGAAPRCRDCRYFVTAPQDGSPDGEKACVEFGTKGVDVACFGFTKRV